MRDGSSSSPERLVIPAWRAVVILAMVVFHLMTDSPTLRPPGIDPPGRGGGKRRKRHNIPGCRKLLITKNGRFYCDGFNCQRFVTDKEIADFDPLGA